MSAAGKLLPAIATANDNRPLHAVPPAGAMLVHVMNPMMPQLGAQRLYHCEGLTVLQAVARAGWNLPSTTVLIRDYELVKRAAWEDQPIGDGELVVLVTMPQGGGNGGASQILAVVAIIALALFAPELAGFAAGALGTTVGATVFAGITVGSLLTVGIVLAGTTLITALLPKPKSLSDSTAGATQSPTYDLSAQSNTARLLDPIPERFGRYKFLPDLSTQAFFDFVNSNQMLMEEFCLGIGEFSIEEIGIANNAIWSDGDYTGTYPEITLQILGPGEANTLFSDNVVTSADVSSIEVIGTNEDGYGWSGPFVLNPATTQAHQIDIDFAAPGGLFSVDSAGNLGAATIEFTVEVQEIDDLGATIGGWAAVITETINQSTRDAIRTTYSASLTPARYQVRFERTNARATDLNTSDQAMILAMRGYLPNAPAQSDTTRIALQATSTKNLNGDSAQSFYVIATRKLAIPSIDPDTGAITWSATTATRSIAWAAAYLCKSSNGLRRQDNQLDVVKLAALDAIWTSRGDHFDGTFDTADSAWTNLQAILRVGRAEPLRVGRWITFNRDEPKTVPKAGFSPANMLAGSFNIDYVMFDANSTDAVWIDYVDNRNWAPNSVFCALPDSTTDPDDAPHISWVGIIEYDHAWREGIFMAAVNRWRRRFPNFRTELDGRVCFRGDYVQVAHWMPGWGASGQVVDYQPNDAGDLLTLSEPWNSPSQFNDDQKLLTLMTPDGYGYGPVTVNLVDDGAESGHAIVSLTQTAIVTKGNYAGIAPAEWDVWSDPAYERPRAMWGTATQNARDALMVAMKPETGNTVTMACVLDDPRVHYVDGTIPPIDDGETPAPPDEADPPAAGTTDDLTITSILAREISTLGSTLLQPNVVALTIVGASDAVNFDAQWRWNGATDFNAVTIRLARTFQIPSLVGSLEIQVRARGKSGIGAWFDTMLFAQGVPTSANPPGGTFEVNTLQDYIEGSQDGEYDWTDLLTDGVTDYVVTYQYDNAGVWTTWSTFTVSGTGTGIDNDLPYGTVRIGVKPIFPSGTASDFTYST